MRETKRSLFYIYQRINKNYFIKIYELWRELQLFFYTFKFLLRMYHISKYIIENI